MDYAIRSLNAAPVYGEPDLENQLQQYPVLSQDEAERNVRDLISTGRYDILVGLLDRQSYSYNQYLPELINNPDFLRALFTHGENYRITNIAYSYLLSPEFRQAMIEYTPRDKFIALVKEMYQAMNYPDIRQAYIAYADPDTLFREALIHAADYPDILEGLLADKQKLAAVDQATLQDALNEALHEGANVMEYYFKNYDLTLLIAFMIWFGPSVVAFLGLRWLQTLTGLYLPHGGLVWTFIFLVVIRFRLIDV